MILPESLVDVARRRPESFAIVDGETRTNYRDLVERARRFATGLRHCGVAAGDRVINAIGQTPDAIALTYGIWMAGAIVVPVNPLSPPFELDAVATHSGARLLVHSNDRAASSRRTSLASDASFITLSELLSGQPTPATGVETPSVSPESLAYLLYTSGTSGRPKAVMLTHGNLAANVASIVAYLELTDRDSVVAVLPFHYSYGASVLHTHLAVGGRIVLERNHAFPQAIVDTMAREAVTGLSGVPSTFALLLSRSTFAEAGLPQLRYVTQAGAAMSTELKRRLQAAVPHARIFVMYGQTEATARLTYVSPDRLAEKIGSAGIPVPNVELAIRDDAGHALMAGERGEIWARGPNIMRGYWQDERATEEVLRDGWLRTGDMGYLDEQGYLYISGRRSDMIKTGAHRVHPLEVEEVVAGVPGVCEVGVAGVDDDILGQAIAAFVILEPGHTSSPETIKARCRERLAPHKIPKHVRFVTTLPRTSSGKLKRHELPDLLQR